jgi:site-specific DNA-methyltransferase (adenine-specific)
MQDMPDNYFDLIITSPPYFNQRCYTGFKDEIGIETSIDEYITILISVFKECTRVVKDTGSIVFNLGDKYKKANLQLIPYRFAIKIIDTLNVKLINNITWCKLNPTPRQFKRRMVSSTEPFFHFIKTNKYKYYADRLYEDKIYNSHSSATNVGMGYYKLIEQSELTTEEKKNAIVALEIAMEKVKRGELKSLRMKIRGLHSMAFGGQDGGRNSQIRNNGFTLIEVPGNPMLKDVFTFPVESIKGINHPAIYPRKLIEKFILLTTDEGDLVLDPFIGSGTTGLVCKQLNRKYIGVDLNKEFVNDASRRIISLN